MSSPEQWTHPEPGVGSGRHRGQTHRRAGDRGFARNERGRRRARPAAHAGGRAGREPRVGSATSPTSTSPRTCSGLYRDMVLVRRFDREANALQRQGQLGIWVPLLGQEAAQIGAGRALQPQDMAFPSYREHGVAWCRGDRPDRAARHLPRHRPRQLGPDGHPLPPLHDRHRQPVPQRHRLRDGPALRGQGRRRTGRRGHHVLLRRRRHQPGRRARGLRLGRGLRRAGRLLLPEQPVGDLRADRAADPGAALPARPAATASPASGSTATTCSPASPSPAGRSRSAAPATARC